MKPTEPGTFAEELASQAQVDDLFPFGGDPGERARRRALAPITISVDPPSTCYLLKLSASSTKDAFAAEFPSLNFEEEFACHSPSAGAHLSVILTGISIGAGIVATEFLKECGKKLWKAVESLLTSKKATQEPRLGGGDAVTIRLHIDQSTVEAHIAGLGPNSALRLQRFLTETPVRLFEEAARVLGAQDHCPSCTHCARAVTALPCRYCIHNGDKLCLVGNAICTLDGIRFDCEITEIERNRKRSFHKPATDG
jgi:hypothetical protein